MAEYQKDFHAETLGQHYCKHVDAMTREGLHDKSDIAVELARRDIEIKRLREALDRFGRHELDCWAIDFGHPHGPKGCNCGLDAAASENTEQVKP